MIETHRRNFDDRRHVDFRAEVLPQNQLEHARDVLLQRMIPVNIDLHPVLEVACLVRHELHHGLHHLHQLRVAVERILVAPIHQQPHDFLERLRHAAPAAHHVVSDVRERHHLRHGLICKNRRSLRLRQLLAQPVRLFLEVDHADEQAVGFTNRLRQFGRFLIELELGVVTHRSVHIQFSTHGVPYARIEMLEADDCDDVGFYFHVRSRITPMSSSE